MAMSIERLKSINRTAASFGGNKICLPSAVLVILGSSGSWVGLIFLDLLQFGLVFFDEMRNKFITERVCQFHGQMNRFCQQKPHFVVVVHRPRTC